MKKIIHLSSLIAIPLFFLVFNCFAHPKKKASGYSIFEDLTTTRKTVTKGSAAINKNYLKPTAELRYLALGDSYTIGQNVSEKERFPSQTVRLLSNSTVNIHSVKYIATSGWTTVNLIDAIKEQKDFQKFDIVTMLIGVNDQFQHMDTGQYRLNFDSLLTKAVTLASNRPSRVFVVSIPDYSVTPFVNSMYKKMVSKEIDVFNTINKQVTSLHQVNYIDITPTSRKAAADRTLLAKDSLHPSGKEYAKWAYLLAPAIKNALK